MSKAATSLELSTHDLTERLRCLLSDAPGVLVAYLYGSHARGRAGPLSDGYGVSSVLTRSRRASRWAPWVLIVVGKRAHTRARW